MEPIDLPTSPSPGASDQNPPLLSYMNQHFDAPHPNYPEPVGLRLDSTVQRQLMVSPHPYVWLESVVFLRIIQAPPTDCLPYCKAVSQAPISQLSRTSTKLSRTPSQARWHHRGPHRPPQRRHLRVPACGHVPVRHDKIVKFMKNTNSPFTVNIYSTPLLLRQPQHLFWRLQQSDRQKAQPGSSTAHRVFDTNFDMLVSSTLKKAICATDTATSVIKMDEGLYNALM